MMKKISINKNINKIKILLYRMTSWLWYDSPIYIDLNIFKLYRYYWDAKKYFIRPTIIKHNVTNNESLGSDYFLIPRECHNEWLHISMHSVEWKLKFDNIEFETVPYICIVIANKYRYIYGLEAPLTQTNNGKFRRDNLLYWEAILWYSIRHKDIVKTYKNNIWNDTNGNKSTIFYMLKDKGKNIIINSCSEL